MTGVFDRLQQKIELEKQEAGITPLDIAELPDQYRKLLKIILREAEMTFTEIQESIKKVHDIKDLNEADLIAALTELTKQMWLIRRGDGDRVRYEVNLRRKAGSGLSGNIWSALDSRLDEQAKKRKQ